MNICVVGTGYVGIVTGTCFAETGNVVTCVDVDANKVAQLNSGRLPIYEPDLENLFARNVREGRLHFTTSLSDSVGQAEVIFLALPTPSNSDGSVDLSSILDVADELGPLLKEYTVIVDKSTVPVGTAGQVRERVAKTAKVDFDVVSNPEFLREGLAVSDFMKPDRVVIGTTSGRAMAALNTLYKPFVRQGNPIYFMDEASAEMTKYAANAFLATKISFMNEIANLCELVGADVDSVRLGLSADDRIGKRFLFAGIGYGGSCLPKDVRGLFDLARQKEYDFEILGAVDRVNARQRMRLFSKILTYYENDVTGMSFALWGLSFKPDTDDIREAPAIELIHRLTAAGARIVAYDPQAMGNARRAMPDNSGVEFRDTPYEALDGADALIIATEWSVFRTPDWSEVGRLLKQRVVFDGRNLFDIAQMRNEQFQYISIGRPVA
jgi:UDPglucose 6-dehydrogenase